MFITLFAPIKVDRFNNTKQEVIELPRARTGPREGEYDGITKKKVGVGGGETS